MNRTNPSARATGGFLSRRAVLGGSAGMTAVALVGGRTAAHQGSTRAVLVQVFLRGAMDGLTTLVPYADPDLYRARPTLAVPPPGGAQGARDLDGFFGLAPAAAPLATPYSDGRLVFVHAAGSRDPTRSHFEGFARMELGDPLLPPGTVHDGWIARTLAATRAQATSPLRAVGAGDRLPLSLERAERSLPIPDFSAFLFPGRPRTATARAAAILAAHAHEPAPAGPAAFDTLASIELLAGVDFAGYVPANGAAYPAGPLGTRLRHTAALIKARRGVEVVTLDVDGWDLHAELGPLDGAMAALLDELARGLEAFYLDLQAEVDEYVLVCLSEFGRRVAENASAGTDHGHGNALFVMGGGIAGGRVIADWPGLAPDALDDGDLAITTDYRDVLGEVLARRLGITDLAAIFPQHTFAFPGVTS